MKKKGCQVFDLGFHRREKARAKKRFEGEWSEGHDYEDARRVVSEFEA